MKKLDDFNEKTFITKLLGIEKQLDRKGAILSSLHTLDDFNNHFSLLLSELEIMRMFAETHIISENIRSTVNYYMNVYYAYIQVIIYMVEFNSIYVSYIDPSFIDNGIVLFSTYDRLVNYMKDNNKIVAPQLKNILSVLIENLRSRLDIQTCVGIAKTIGRKKSIDLVNIDNCGHRRTDSRI